MSSKLVDFKLDNGETIKVAEQAAEYLNRYLKCVRNIKSLDTLILFGSVLEERYTPGKSDIDMVYIAEDRDKFLDEAVEEEFKECYTFFDMEIPTDELAFTKEEFDKLEGRLKYELDNKAKVVYKQEWNSNNKESD